MCDFAVRDCPMSSLDYEGVAALVRNSFGTLVREGIKTPTACISADEIKGRMHSKAFCAFDYNSKLAGIILINIFHQNICYLDICAVSPDYQNKGVGTILARFMELNLRDSGLKYIYLNTMAPAKYNIRFYEKIGYKKYSFGRFTGNYFSIIFRKYPENNTLRNIYFSIRFHLIKFIYTKILFKNSKDLRIIGKTLRLLKHIIKK